jgi:phage gpG-like protein
MRKMPGVFTVLGFVAELKAIEHDLEALAPKIVEKACQIIQKKAKATIGHEHDAWPPLAPSTLAKKSANTPLLETGAMRDSIEYVVHGNEGAVGSNSEIAVFQELGTSRIPPRSFLVSSAIASEDKIHRMVGASAVAALSGHGRHVHDVRELLHLLHRAGHALAELGHDLVDDEQEHKR